MPREPAATQLNLRRDERRAELFAALDRIAPTIEASAAHADEQRRLPPEVFAALGDAGLFRLCVPACLGGYEADPPTQVEVIEAVSRLDTGAGWVVGVGAITTGLVTAGVDEAALDELTSHGVPVAAGQIAPTGRARRVPGGYQVSGRFRFGSGIHGASWVVGGCAVENANGSGPAVGLAVVPAREVTIIDNWDVAGLRATGSCDYEIDGAFVPDGRFLGVPVAQPRRGGPLYRQPVQAMAAPLHLGFPLGAGRRALDEIAALAARTTRTLAGSTIGSQPVFQTELARCDAQLRAARLLALDTAEHAWSCLQRGDAIGADLERDLHVAALHATEVAMACTTLAWRAAGTAAARADSAIQRLFRDVHASVHHVFVSPSVWEQQGAALVAGAGEAAR